MEVETRSGLATRMENLNRDGRTPMKKAQYEERNLQSLLDGKEHFFDPTSRDQPYVATVAEPLMKGKPRGTGGRPSLSYANASRNTQRTRFANLKKLVIEKLEDIFEDEDEDLVDEFTTTFLSKLFYDEKEADEQDAPAMQQLTENVRFFYQDLPFVSPMKSVVMLQLFRDISAASTARMLGISERRVRACWNYYETQDVFPLAYFLTGMGFRRDRMGDRETTLLDWLEDAAPVRSGRDKRSFKWRGDCDLIYARYFADMKEAGEDKPVSPQYFANKVSHERIGFRAYDIFDNDNRTRLAELEKLLPNLRDDPLRAAAVEEEIQELKDEIAFADGRRLALKQDIKDLNGTTTRCVILGDFSGVQTSMDQKFHIYVIVVLTHERLVIPEQLKV